ncbi:filamentous hemagglutinin N-terminal domain-containing protein [Dulcicalothrix desertica]|nr:filamentous hemagglutinin N-terminal domain-containing protein [Dulcicalothrix desertica]
MLQPATAQVIPDGSMNTTLAPNININGVLTDRVDGGAQVGSNLFHSFSSFNINPSSGVYFTNPTDVTNIFARVTGTSSSNINGTLGVLGGANLFLMNPNGIVFNSGANLDLNGSFLATTASNISFADGKVFATQNTSSSVSILTQSVPIGLGFGSNPGKISVNGAGHQLTAQDPNFAPYINMGNTTGLHAKPGKTLALVGSQVNLDGGILTAPQGQIKLGSVSSNSTVGLKIDNRFSFGYENVSSFENISLSRSSLLDATGNGGGSIQLNGRSVSLTDGSVASVQNIGVQKAGDIRVNASETLELKGTAPNNIVRSTIGNNTVAGSIGDIYVNTKQLIIEDGGAIGSRSYSQSNGGNVYINATESTKVAGVSPVNPAAFSSIASITLDRGKSGDIFVNTPNLFVLDGGAISATSFGRGNGGNVNVNASNIEVNGTAKTIFGVSTISSSNLGLGNAGNINFNTNSLTIANGGNINTASSSNGNAGSITINANQDVQVLDNSILASSVALNRSFQSAFNLPEFPSGNSGHITINTGILTIANAARVGVNNSGTGSAGTVTINAGAVKLDNQGALSAVTASGNGGNIALISQNLLLRRDSSISTDARGPGNGGNINLNIGTIALTESLISANAVQQKGGNITINTQGLFNFNSSITATGASNGEIKIITPDIKQDNSLQQQASNFINAEQAVASSCLVNRNAAQSRFVVTGNGGLPQTPDNQEVQYTLTKPQAINTINTVLTKNTNFTIRTSSWKLGDKINEATQLVKTSDGRILLNNTSNYDVNTVQLSQCS